MDESTNGNIPFSKSFSTELLYDICEIYIDDLLIMANSENEFIDVLKIVLQRFRDKSILLNPKKLH